MGSDAAAAEPFATAFLANNWQDLRIQLANDVAFGALASPRVTEVQAAEAATAVMSSFDSDERVTEIETVDTESISVMQRATYRFRNHADSRGKSCRIEQHVFATLNQDGSIAKEDLIYSGWARTASP